MSYFKGNRVWHVIGADGATCTRCGFEVRPQNVKLEKSDGDPECQEISPEIQAALKNRFPGSGSGGRGRLLKARPGQPGEKSRTRAKPGQNP